MKYLKYFKNNEAINERDWEVFDIFQDLFDEFDYKVPSYVKQHPNHHSLSLSGSFGSIDIADGYCYNARCLKIRMTDDSNSRLIKKGCYKNFDGILNKEYIEILEEAHLRMIDYLSPKKVIVGSLGVYTRDLDLLYFYEEPDFSRYKGVEIYGDNIAVHLEKLNMDLTSNSRHSNMFSAYDGSRSLESFCLMYYYEEYFYKIKDITAFNAINNVNLYNWVKSEWEIICKKINIKEGQKVLKSKKIPKITIAEFMAILKNKQDNYGK